MKPNSPFFNTDVNIFSKVYDKLKSKTHRLKKIYKTLSDQVKSERYLVVHKVSKGFCVFLYVYTFLTNVVVIQSLNFYYIQFLSFIDERKY